MSQQQKDRLLLSLSVPLLFFAILAFIGYWLHQDRILTRDQTTATTTPNGSVAVSNLVTELSAPVGFQLQLFAKGVAGARVLTFDPNNVLLVSQTESGKVSALPDKNSDGVADQVLTVVSGLTKPHGLAFRCPNPTVPSQCQLYVAEGNQLSVFDYEPSTFKATNKRKLLDLPSIAGARHFTRTLLFRLAPNDDTLLIAIGSSCDVCRESDPNRASILAYDINTGKSHTFATGLRNSAFMTINPLTQQVVATEMGRDNLGDNLPPDEINIIEEGKNYGWPICYGQNIHDTNFDHNTYIRNPCQLPTETPAWLDLPAHSAPLGLAFIPQKGWGDKSGNLLVAYHGSWNRSQPTGYKIVELKLDSAGGYVSSNDFITGWLDGNTKTGGRPVDIKTGEGGVAYISDDGAGVVYKLSRK